MQIRLVGPYVNERSLMTVKPRVRVRIRVCMLGDPVVLSDFIEWITTHEPSIVSSPEGPVLDIPERFAHLVPAEVLHADDIQLNVVLTGILAEGKAFRVDFEGSLPAPFLPPNNVRFRLVERTRKTVVKVPCRSSIPAERPMS